MNDDQIALADREGGQNAKDHSVLRKNRVALSMPKQNDPTVHLLGHGYTYPVDDAIPSSQQ